MIIKTITCHDVYNYGASLQAYALQHYLQSLGHVVDIIDYKPEYLCGSYKFGYLPRGHRFYDIASHNRIFWFLYGVRMLPVTFGTWRRICPFKSFKKHYLKCTGCYRSVEELRDTPPTADIYIAGSDQIWNFCVENGQDPAFYLDFGPESVLRVSYAASFGVSFLPKDNAEWLKSQLNRFDSISVRETSGLSILESLGLSGNVVMDPVFLLSKNEWVALSGTNKVVNFDYLLVYDLTNDDRLEQSAKQIAKRFNLSIVAVNDKQKISFADYNIDSAGPVEFLNLILNASYILTDSFHCTSFALIFNIPFTVYYSKNNISRIFDLLSNVGCLQNLNPETYIETNDWEVINERLRVECAKSQQFLLDVLRRIK